MIKLINILNEQDEQEKQNPFDKYGIRVTDVEKKKDLPEPTKKKAAPPPAQKKPVRTAGRRITTSEFLNFKNKLTTRLGIKLTPERHRFFEAWRRSEGTDATYNPFSTAWPRVGDTKWSRDPGMTIFNFNEDGEALVKNYSTIDAGVEATAKTLEQPKFSDLLGFLSLDTYSAEDLLKTISVYEEIDLWGTNPETMIEVLKTIPTSGEEDTSITPPGELVSISTMNPEEADSHFWDIVTKWVEAEYQFWKEPGTGKGPDGVKNPQIHDKMFRQFRGDSLLADDKEAPAQRQYWRTRIPAIKKLYKQLLSYEDIWKLVKTYGKNAIWSNYRASEGSYSGKLYDVPKGTPDYAQNRVRWFLQILNWINQITMNIIATWQSNIEIVLEWEDGAAAFRRSVQAEIDPYEDEDSSDTDTKTQSAFVRSGYTI